MGTILVLIAFILAGVNSQRYHIPDIGPYDELSSEELQNAYRNLGTYLGRDFIETHFFQSDPRIASAVSYDVRTRVIHAALEVPPKQFRRTLPFPRFARIALYTPGEPLVTEYLVGTTINQVNVTKLRSIPSIKRPVDEIETKYLHEFLGRICSGKLGIFLKEYYGASFLYDQSSECIQDSRSTRNPDSFPACLFGMFASPRVTMSKPNRRIAAYRLNRFIPPYNQHPIDVHISIDHTKDDPNLWKVDGFFVQAIQFSSLEDFFYYKSLFPYSFKKNSEPILPFQADHTVKMGPDLCPRSELSNINHNYQEAFDGSVINKHVRYGPWGFHLGVRHETGLRFYNITFNGELIINEAGMDETATIYGGRTPFMESMTSLETMFNVGSLTSELSPGIDCPVDAIYLSVPILPSPQAGTKTVHNGICIYESSADVHESAVRRHYQEFGDGSSYSSAGYATGKTEKSLYVVTLAAIYNYQYAFVNVFSPTGSYACYVVPSGYIHVDNPIYPLRQRYGFLSQRFNLTFNIHTHHFLFFVDALGSQNMVEQIKVYAEGEQSGYNRMNMEVGRLVKESEGQLKGSDPLTKTAICLEKSAGSEVGRCLNVMNLASMPSLVTMTASRSFPWIRKGVWFTRYKTDELRASSIYNGVDLTDPVVDFAHFSNDEPLDGDIVMWINVGFLHIPVNEDIPHTPSKNSQLGFILRPSNFFFQSPDSLVAKGSVFTTNKREWINGYVPKSHRDCSAGNTTG